MKPVPKPVSLADIKADPRMTDFALVRQSRLSVVPVTDEQWEAYSLEMGWYEDEDRMGYEQGHVCCPDCGCDKNDHTCHAEGCPRVDTPVQCGPPWLPLVASR